MDRARVTTVIVSHNTRDLLLQAIESVLEHGGAAAAVVVVDNASDDQSVDAVRRQFPEVRVIANDKNEGFAKACNRGIASASGELILLLNSDARITQGALETLIDCMNALPRCGAAGCIVRTPDGRAATTTRNFLTPFNQALELLGVPGRWLRRTYTPRPDPQGRDCSVDWIEASCLLLRREAIDQTGLFDERYFMYSEDEDLCYRLRSTDWVICYTARCSVVHVGGASSARYGVEMLRHFYLSQMQFLLKHRGKLGLFVYICAMRFALLLKWLRPRRVDEANSSLPEDRLTAFNRARSMMRQAK
ncbi:MAG TPA: glycosyltransferase family 2 protein [Blastocatellia bacterium]|nr:glycosyltransferase family 2 protein [Blastocatellia bacterium]